MITKLVLWKIIYNLHYKINYLYHQLITNTNLIS